MNDKQKKWLLLVGLCGSLLFVLVFGCNNSKAIKPVTTAQDKILPDLGMKFEEFQEKYNDIAVKNKSKYLLNNGNIKKQWLYYLCGFSYATMKIGIDEKTQNISYIEIYGEYTNKISKDEKKALLFEQKKIFEIASEVFDEQLQGSKEKGEKKYILNHDLEYWNGSAVTLTISAKKIPHISIHTEELPKEKSSSSDVSYLVKGFWWLDSNGNLHQIYKNVRIKWTGRSIILSNGSTAFQFEFLEGTYAGEFGYWSSSFQ